MKYMLTVHALSGSTYNLWAMEYDDVVASALVLSAGK